MALGLKQVSIRQMNTEFVVVSITGASGAVGEGSSQVSCVRNSAGNYTITLTETALRTIRVVGAAPATANLQHQVSAQSSSAITVIFTNNSGTATDTNFDITLCVFRWAEKF